MECVGGVQRQEEEGQMMCCEEGTVGRGLNGVRSKFKQMSIFLKVKNIC